MSNGYNEEARVNSEQSENTTEGDYAYKKVIRDKHQRRTWSVVAIVLAVMSILLVYFSWVSLALAVLSIGAGLISRKNLGYFDKITLYSMIIAIFGVVFSLVGVFFGDFILQLFK